MNTNLIRKIKLFLTSNNSSNTSNTNSTNNTANNNFNGSVSLSREYFSQSLGIRSNRDEYDYDSNDMNGSGTYNNNKKISLLKLHQLNSRLLLFAEVETDNTTSTNTNNSMNDNNVLYPSNNTTTTANNNDTTNLNDYYIDIDVFQKVLQASGLTLDEDEIHIIANSTDISPYAMRINCNVLTTILKSTSTTTNGNMNYDSFNQTNKGNNSNNKDVLRHLNELLMREARKQKRNENEWSADLLAILKGYDSDNTGIMNLQEFSDCLNIINIILPSKLLSDICQQQGTYNIDQCNINYQDMINIALNSHSSSSSSAIYNNDFLNTHSSNIDSQSNSRSKLGRGNISANLNNNTYTSNQYSHTNNNNSTMRDNKPFAVNSLLKTVSRYLHRHSNTSNSKNTNSNNSRNHTRNTTANNNNEQDSLWTTLLTCFKRFDDNNNNIITAREFTLAVSILVDEDELILSNEDWIDIIDYYTTNTNNSNNIMNNSSNNYNTNLLRNRNDIPIDYMRFCQHVIEYSKSHEFSDSSTNRTIGTSSSGGRNAKPSAYKDNRTTTRTSNINNNSNNKFEMSNGMNNSLRNRTLQGTLTASSPTNNTIRGSRINSTSRPVSRNSNIRNSNTATNANTAMNKNNNKGVKSIIESRLGYKNHSNNNNNNNNEDNYDSDNDNMNLNEKIQLFLDSEEGLYRLDKQRMEKLNAIIFKEYNDNELEVLNTIRYEILVCLNKKIKTNSTTKTSNLTMFQLLTKRLEDEDTNHNGSISRKQFLAMLKGVGFRTELYFKNPIQKKILDTLENGSQSISTGFKGSSSTKDIQIKDILCIIFNDVLHNI